MGLFSAVCFSFRGSISRAGIQPSEGKRKGCQGSRKGGERVIKVFYTRREHARRL